MTRYGYITRAMTEGRGILASIDAHGTVRRPDVVPVWSRFDTTDPGHFALDWRELDALRSAGIEPVVYAESGRWHPRDDALRLLAARARGAGIRWLHEPNGGGIFEWQAWEPATVRDELARAGRIFHEEGARLIWCVSVNAADWSPWYPGHDVVDIVAFDQFRRRTDSATPSFQARRAVRRLAAIAPGKPVWWCETGDLRGIPDRADAIADFAHVEGVDVILDFDLDIVFTGANGSPQHDDWTWDGRGRMDRAFDRLPIGG